VDWQQGLRDTSFVVPGGSAAPPPVKPKAKPKPKLHHPDLPKHSLGKLARQSVGQHSFDQFFDFNIIELFEDGRARAAARVDRAGNGTAGRGSLEGDVGVEGGHSRPEGAVTGIADPAGSLGSARYFLFDGAVTF
jgi:hypothetical protein